MKTDTKIRDGVWIADGLGADFVVLYQHPHCPQVYRVRTAAGDHYAFEKDLHFDHKQALTK